MTLCIAWVREAGDTSELVFATDSTLTGGEKWNHGIKLFELPRKDCFLCFAGETYRAYPLILNLISTIKHDDKLQDSKLDIQEVLYSIVETFTELVNSIFNKPRGDNSYIGTEAKFLFGGWSWKEQVFRVWRLYYSADAKAFLHKDEITKDNRLGKIAFLGDPETAEKNVAELANKKYKAELVKRDIYAGRLDMEPLAVLVDMSRDTSVYEVDGALQIGKVYRSGGNEFFGTMWPSIKGKPSFLGKIYSKHNKPRVRYFDPDSCEIIEEEIPKCLRNLEAFNGSEDYDFLKTCYSQDDNFLKQSISDKERERLVGIFKEHSFQEFKRIAETPSAEVNLTGDEQ